MTPEIKARVEADMALVESMDFRQRLTFLSCYTVRFDGEIRRGEATRDGIRAYADSILEVQRARR